MYLLVFTLLISLYIVHQLFPAPILSYFVGLLVPLVHSLFLLRKQMGFI
nr:hypothetical protein P5627_01370 [Bacillus safensis]